ncbi:MAG: tetratricopeptide repeat protein [Candidatus Sumerlaeota bacterium]|nr:tetratricopeptide repeat protein [Candidatus Sumerlaeota bacterium]
MKDDGEFAGTPDESLYQMAMDLLESDHCEEALQAFDSVVEQQPFNADAFFHRGIALSQLRRFEDAITSFELAIGLAPAQPYYHTHYGHALLVSSRYDEAIEHFDIALDLEPGDYHNKIYKACALAEKHRFGAARRLIEGVLSDHPHDLVALRQYGALLAALGEDPQALEQYDKILKTQPNNLDVMRRRADLLLRQGMLEDAIRSLRELLALDPGDADIWVILLRVLTDRNEYDACAHHAGEAISRGIERADIYALRGFALLELRRPEESLADLRRARGLDELVPETHFLIGRALAEMRKNRAALSSTMRALQLRPGDPRFLIFKAHLHHKLGDYAAEGLCLSELAEAKPDDFDIARMKAGNELIRGKLAEAAATIGRFLVMKPDHEQALLLAAEFNERLGDMTAAMNCYRRIFSGEEAGPHAFISYGAFLLRHHAANEAVEALRRALKIFPDNPNLILCCAAALQQCERNDEVIETVRPLVESGKASPECHWMLGKACFSLNRHHETLEHFEKARNLSDKDGESMPPASSFIAVEAMSLLRVGRAEEGIRLLEKNTSQFEQARGEYFKTLGMVCLEAGNFSRALEAFASGARACPDKALFYDGAARAAAMMGNKRQMLDFFARAVELDPGIAGASLSRPEFRRYALNPAFNRLVGFRCYFMMLKGFAWAAAGAAGIALLVLLAARLLRL